MIRVNGTLVVVDEPTITPTPMEQSASKGNGNGTMTVYVTANRVTTSGAPVASNIIKVVMTGCTNDLGASGGGSGHVEPRKGGKMRVDGHNAVVETDKGICEGKLEGDKKQNPGACMCELRFEKRCTASEGAAVKLSDVQAQSGSVGDPPQPEAVGGYFADRALSAGPGATTAQSRVSGSNDRQRFESIIATIMADVTAAGIAMVIDGSVRAAYDREVARMAGELRDAAQAGRMTWHQAAEEAHSIRDTVMKAMRGRSTPFGKAIAERIKPENKTLNRIIAEKTQSLFPGKNFHALNKAQKERVYAEIVNSAGKSNPKITARMRNVSRAGRALIVLSIAVSIYTIATAEDKMQSAKQEAVVTGVGIVSAAGGGALAGLACGPGAPVCVTIGAFACGALAAFGVDVLFF